VFVACVHCSSVYRVPAGVSYAATVHSVRRSSVARIVLLRVCALPAAEHVKHQKVETRTHYELTHKKCLLAFLAPLVHSSYLLLHTLLNLFVVGDDPGNFVYVDHAEVSTKLAHGCDPRLCVCDRTLTGPISRQVLLVSGIVAAWRMDCFSGSYQDSTMPKCMLVLLLHFQIYPD